MGVYEALPTPAALLTASYNHILRTRRFIAVTDLGNALVVPAYTATELEDSYQKGGAHWMRSMNRSVRGVRAQPWLPLWPANESL
jgi:hypothetical protein